MSLLTDHIYKIDALYDKGGKSHRRPFTNAYLKISKFYTYKDCWFKLPKNKKRQRKI